MGSRLGPHVPGGSQDGSALEALLSAERAIAERLAQAEAESARIVGEARARLEQQRSEARAAMQDELDAADRAQRAAAARDESAAAEHDARERHRLDSVTDAELLALADTALALVLGLQRDATMGRAP
ncbi:MAG TPA: hypothetical protein PKC83_15495 [Gemmatimonadaceae bacterium]|nr:hypothetical protein [Gemmatimonadaceae bacterium]